MVNRATVFIDAGRPAGSASFIGNATLTGDILIDLVTQEDAGTVGGVVVAIPVLSGLILTSGTNFNQAYIDASWSQPADDRVLEYEIQVERDTEGVVMAFRTDQTSIRIEPILSNAGYDVTVWSILTSGRRDQTLTGSVTGALDSTVPATVGGLTIGMGLRTLTADWTDNVEPDVTFGQGRYRIQVDDAADFATPVYDKEISGTVVSVTDLSPNTQYWVRVKALDTSNNESVAWSTVVNDTTSQTVLNDMGVLSVDTAQLVDAAIEEAKLNDSAVTVNKIGPFAVTAAKIDALAVETAKIALLAVETAQIGLLQVDTAQIAMLAVDSAKIANLAVGDAKIANATITNAKIIDLDAARITGGTVHAANIVLGGLHSRGVVHLLTGTTGEISSVTVNAITVTSAAVPFATDLETTATNLAANIQANTSVPDYNAVASGTTVYISAVATGAGPDGFVVVSTVTGDFTKSDVNMAGGASAGVIKSEDYVAATSGFLIDGAGNLEMNSGNFRGALVAASGSFAGDISSATGTFTGALSVGTSNTILKVNSTGDLWIGHATETSAPFRVTNTGVVTIGSADDTDLTITTNQSFEGKNVPAIFFQANAIADAGGGIIYVHNTTSHAKALFVRSKNADGDGAVFVATTYDNSDNMVVEAAANPQTGTNATSTALFRCFATGSGTATTWLTATHNTTGRADVNIAADSTGAGTSYVAISAENTITLTATSLLFKSGLDNKAEFGKARVGLTSGLTGHATFGHEALDAVGDYGWLQRATGGTIMNASTGQDKEFRTNNANDFIFNQGRDFFMVKVPQSLGTTVALRRQTSSGTVCYATSSERYKKDIVTLKLVDALKILDSRAIWYRDKEESSDVPLSLGLSAESVEAAGMEAFVNYAEVGPDGVVVEPEDPTHGTHPLLPMNLDYEQMVAPLIVIIRDMRERMDEAGI